MYQPVPPSPSQVFAFDTRVRMRRPVASAIASLATFGVFGAVVHAQINGELERFGRRRGTMPFAFIRANAALATVAWIFGLLAWLIGVLASVAYIVDIVNGRTPVAADISGVALIALMLAPLWLTLLHTGRRMRTAQHLVGVTGDVVDPWRVAITGTVFPPLGTWYCARAMNRAWGLWQQHPSPPPPGVVVL